MQIERITYTYVFNLIFKLTTSPLFENYQTCSSARSTTYIVALSTRSELFHFN